MKKNFIRILSVFLVAVLLFTGCAVSTRVSADTSQHTAADLAKKKGGTKATEPTAVEVVEDGTYTSKEEVAEYIHRFGHLPDNYIKKRDAQDLGWVASKGNLWKVAPGMSIGGDRFGNYEELLPTASKRRYFECDIDFDGKYRNAKRIIFSNDGLIYYTEDHYQSFELLYGEVKK